jgi:hypothetical protein
MKKLPLLLLFLMLFFSIAEAGKSVAKLIPYPTDYDIATEGASSVKGLGDHSRSPYFSHPDFYNMKNGGSLVILEKFKTYQQTTEWSCGNAAALMVLHHFGNTAYDELALAKSMGTNPLPADGVKQKDVLYGTTASGIANFFRSANYEVTSSIDALSSDGTTFSNPLNFRAWVLTQLKNNTPIMVDWTDWSGHWQVLIGYDTMGTETIYDDVLIFADPYDVGDQLQDGYYIFPAYRFYYMWQDILFQPEGHREQQWVIAKPK